MVCVEMKRVFFKYSGLCHCDSLCQLSGLRFGAMDCIAHQLFL